jgi:hypothetical protein
VLQGGAGSTCTHWVICHACAWLGEEVARRTNAGGCQRTAQSATAAPCTTNPRITSDTAHSQLCSTVAVQSPSTAGCLHAAAMECHITRCAAAVACPHLVARLERDGVQAAQRQLLGASRGSSLAQ